MRGEERRGGGEGEEDTNLNKMKGGLTARLEAKPVWMSSERS
jgi:hypothetical protein